MNKWILTCCLTNIVPVKKEHDEDLYIWAGWNLYVITLIGEISNHLKKKNEKIES